MRVLCVCLGNICRSPLAEGVLAAKAAAAGLSVEVDSAGTGAWHAGEAPHPRSIAAARARGYDIAAQRARQVRAEDYRAFDLILAMDLSNLATLDRGAPPDATAERRLFDGTGADVPDPYGASAEAFDRVLDRIEAAADRLIAELSRRG